MIDPRAMKGEWFVSSGIKSNRKCDFNVHHDGQFWYRLLQDIEHQAEESKHFPDIQRYVLESIEIRQQLKDQGF